MHGSGPVNRIPGHHLARRGAIGHAPVVLNRVPRIRAVELNPRVLSVLRRARGTHTPYDPRSIDPADVVVAEGRGYLERTRRRFDLIQISLVDSFSASR